MLTSNDNYSIPNTSYVNKDFQTIYPELLNIIKELTYRWDPTITDESDPLIVLTKLNALIADKANYNIDKNVLETSPLTVSQIENARPLFEQLGYNMKWYQAAETEISLKWKDSIIKESTEEQQKNYKNVYTLPIFTTFSDVNGEYVYTLTKDTQVVVDNSISTERVLQGTPVTLQVGDTDTITFVNLDINNRIYFPDYNVAENGIFITIVDKNDYEEWQKVDNLFVQNLGTKVYKFGVDKRQRFCYIEFPQDISSIMGAGLKITYIKTDGYNGSVGANVLTQLFTDVEANGKNDVGNDVDYRFTKDNLYVTNLIGSSGGQDPESIVDAYRNYKKVAGTFNTLVSLRDYINYFIREESVSNCFVCDRMNDIQTAYKIMNYENGLYRKITEWEEKEVNNEETELNRLEPFDLKLYALQWIDNIDDVNDYANSFSILPYYSEDVNKYTDCYPEYFIVDPDFGVLSQEDADNGVQSVRHICHDFVPQDYDKIILLKNKYPLIIKIVPQYKLTDIQTQEVKENILVALVKALNSQKVNFGESPEYEFVYKTIQDSDPRIKATVLDTFTYYTFASYYEKYYVNPDGTESTAETDYIKYRIKEICISDETPYTEGYYYDGQFYSDKSYLPTYLLKPNSGVYCLDKSNQNIYISKVNKNQWSYELYSQKRNDFRREIYAKTVLNGNTPIYKEDEFFYQPGQDEISIEYEVESVSPYTSVVVSKEKEIQGGRAAEEQGASNDTITITADYLPGSFYAEKTVDDYPNVGDITKVMWFDNGNVRTSLTNNQLNTDIIKTVSTNGKYSQSSNIIQATITYTGNSCIFYFIDSASQIGIRGCKYIYKECDPQTRVNKTVDKNSSVTFYTPSLMDETKYSTYTKVLRYKTNGSGSSTTYSNDFQGQDIEKNIAYTIKKNEYFTFLWRLEDDNTYRYRTYKEGDILTCSFNFEQQEVVSGSSSTNFTEVNELMSNIVNGSSDYDSYLPNITLNSYRYRGNTITNSSLTEYISQVLATKSIAMQGGNNIQIKKINDVVVSDVSNRYYWILNEKRLDQNSDREEYVLFEEGQTDYILKNNEYFLYYNKQGTALYSVGYGTRIHRENTQDSESLPKWSVTAISYDSIASNSAYLDDIMKLNDGKIKVVVSENQMIEAGESAQIGITINNSNGENNAIKYGVFTKDGYIIAVDNSETSINSVMVGEQNTKYEFLDTPISLANTSGSWEIMLDIDFTVEGDADLYNHIKIGGSTQPVVSYIKYSSDNETVTEVTAYNGSWTVGYKNIRIKNVSDNQSGTNIQNKTNTQILNEEVKLDENDSPMLTKVYDSIFIPITDTNIYVDNEKINWYYGDIQDGSNAFSQLAVKLSNETITALVENQHLKITQPDNTELTISGNLIPNVINQDNTLSDYISTCILSTPDVQTVGELYKDVTYKEANGETKYTKMYFYKNKLPLIKDEKTETTSYISGNSEIIIKLDAISNGSKTIEMNLPESDIGEYVFNVTIYGLPSEVTIQDESSPTKYLQFSSNVYETKYLGSDSIPPTSIKITKNNRYSFVYNQKTIKDITLNWANLTNCILTIQFSKMYPISCPDFVGNKDEYKEILQKIAELDHESKFDYTYQIPDTEYIENPLSGVSFTDGSHPYNKFTISQIYNVDTVVTNKII